MALLLREMARTFKYLFVELGDKRVAHLPMMASPLPVMALVACYYLFVTRYGPWWMSERRAFNLDRIIQVYDVVQIALALYITERSLSLGWWSKFNWFCEPVDYSTTPEALQVMHMVYLYFLVKILDLLDTVFFVLRKKNAQVTFLHVYHHGGMVLGVWIGVKYLAGGHGTFVGFVNSIVHAVMYSYYLVTSLYPQYKNNIWWKKHITQLQMVQFFLLSVHQGQVLFQPNCDYPRLIPLLTLPQYTFFLWLFYDFYRKAYRTSEAKAA